MLRAFAWGGVVGAVVAQSDLLASNNLLPRRVGLHLAAVAALAVLAAGRRHPARPPVALGMLVVVGVATWTLSPVAALGLPGLVDFLAAVILCATIATAPIHRSTVVTMVLVLGVGGAVLGVLEQYAALPLGEATRPAGWFASRSTAAAFCSAVLPLVWWRRRPRLLAVLLSVVLVVFIISTRSRAAWVAAATIVSGLLALLRGRRREVVLSLVVGGLLAAIATPGPLMRWASETPYTDSASSLARLDVGDRASIWWAALRPLARRPWGFGPGSFEAAFAPHAPPQFAARDVRVESSHCEALRLLFELGLPGALVVCWLTHGLWRRASRRTWLLRFGTASLVICALTGKTFEEPPTLVLAALLAGLQLRAQRRFRFSLPRAASSVGLAALAGLVVFTDGTQLRASRELARAQQAQRGGRMREAWLLAEPTLRDARDLGAWLWAMDVLAAAGDRTRCLSVAQQALAYSPGNPLLLRHQDACRP